MKLLSISVSLLMLCSCEPVLKSKQSYTSYTVLVNYMNNGVAHIPPSDTIIVNSINEPSIVIRDGVSYLMGDEFYSPIAVYVRSFKIIKNK